MKEFNQRLGTVKFHQDKMEITTKSGLFGLGKKETQIIEFENIDYIQLLGIDELGYGISSNPLKIKVIRVYMKNSINHFDIDQGLKHDKAVEIYSELEIILKTRQDIALERRNALEKDRLNKLNSNIFSILELLDNDKDGNVDLVENDFNKLLNKNQKTILGVDAKYIHQFVKVSNFIKTKKQNTQKIFESIRDTSSQEELEERVALLKNQMHSYELLVFHSINMIGALVSEDLITFYEIYESFDKLGMFNSNWENEVSEKLTNIGDKLDDLMYSIYNMEQNIVSELSHLSYITQESFDDLNRSVTNQLKEVESSINTNNLLSGIQAYQLYKINKNTRGLNN